ncbi:MAG: protoheme IX farnesyltransferase [Candidatus Omnitrophica bacterium]|nr:protoheme IX farnesyltransferase [Candidatus Omnitrophota bacterium]
MADNRWVHRFSVGVACATLLLVAAGGLVTGTGSGLSVPDWPLSYGQFFPPMVGGIRFEHTHRMIAGAVGILTFFLALAIWAREKRRWLRWFGAGAFAAVLIQAILGGITVLFFLPLPVSVAHACLAQSFFSWIAAIALFTSKSWKKGRRTEAKRGDLLRFLSVAMTASIFVQLAMGALIRHGQRHPLLVAAHILTALIIFLQALLIWAATAREEKARGRFFRHVAGLAILIFLQVSLGVTALLARGALTGTAHQVMGALVLCLSLLLTLRFFRHLEPSAAESKGSGFWQLIRLTKPRLTLMALATTALGFMMAAPGPAVFEILAHVLFGSALVGGGANALNQFMEKDVDAKMKRTEGRPLPSGRLDEKSALIFGAAASLAGVGYLLFFANPLTAFLAFLTVAIYVFIYTPLKRKTALNTFVGAVAGALPVVIGWAGAGQGLDGRAAILFSILFLWQLPHFLAISWVYREDYLKSGLRMVCLLDEGGGWLGRQIVFYCLLLWAASLLPSLVGLSGGVYFSVIFMSNLIFLWLAVYLAVQKLVRARQFVSASILYLLTVIGVMMADKI